MGRINSQSSQQTSIFSENHLDQLNLNSSEN
jgi:hypothetical protein